MKEEIENNRLVAGIDILPGHSPSGRRQPHYALVFIRDGEIIDSYEDVSFTRLVRLLWEYKPRILAIDNVFELAPSIDALRQVIQLLPPQTILVQATGWGANTANLRTIARDHGIEVHGKLSPLKTAYLVAAVAEKGGGFKIKLLEEKTKIIISKNRTVSHGGMSYDRYRRSINASILAATREVKRRLDRQGLDYDLSFRKSSGGLERSVFTVYAPRERLQGVIKPFKNKNVKLVIRPVYRNRVIVSANTPKSKPGLILGIDPGIYTGLALIDLDGRPILIYSSKNLDREEILNMITGYGKVVAVATDVSHPPDLVRKIASTLGAQLYVPQRDLTNDEKRVTLNAIQEKYPNLEVDDTHKRDALAAAYKAYQSLAAKLRQAEAHIDEIGLDIDVDAVKIMISKGQSMAEAIEAEIERIIKDSLTEHEEDMVEESGNESIDSYEERIRELQNKINKLQAENVALKQRIAENEQQLRNYEIELKTLKHVQISPEDELLRKMNMLNTTITYLRKRIEYLTNKIEKLRDENARLRHIIDKLVEGNYSAHPKYTNMSSIPLDKIEDDSISAIFVDTLSPIDRDVIKRLKEKRVGILTASSCNCEELMREYRIPFVKLRDTDLIDLGDRVLVKEDNVSMKLSESWKTIEEMDADDQYARVLDILRSYKERRRKLFGEKYDDII